MASGEVTHSRVSSVLQRQPQATTMADSSLPVVPAPVAAPGPAPSAAVPRVPFHCSECGKSFRYRSDLRRHFARHTALKPHACPRCGKGFKHSFNLANHLRSHTGERPYRCSACPKGFRDSTGLLHHQVSRATHGRDTGTPVHRERQPEMSLAGKCAHVSLLLKRLMPASISSLAVIILFLTILKIGLCISSRSMYTQLFHAAMINFPYMEHRPSRELSEAFRKLTVPQAPDKG